MVAQVVFGRIRDMPYILERADVFWLQADSVKPLPVHGNALVRVGDDLFQALQLQSADVLSLCRFDLRAEHDPYPFRAKILLFLILSHFPHGSKTFFKLFPHDLLFYADRAQEYADTKKAGSQPRPFPSFVSGRKRA